MNGTPVPNAVADGMERVAVQRTGQKLEQAVQEVWASMVPS
ncbi:MAG: hypothetical protein ACREUR_06315 [Nitrosospira sp.]